MFHVYVCQNRECQNGVFFGFDEKSVQNMAENHMMETGHVVLSDRTLDEESI